MSGPTVATLGFKCPEEHPGRSESKRRKADQRADNDAEARKRRTLFGHTDFSRLPNDIKLSGERSESAAARC